MCFYIRIQRIAVMPYYYETASGFCKLAMCKSMLQDRFTALAIIHIERSLSNNIIPEEIFKKYTKSYYTLQFQHILPFSFYFYLRYTIYTTSIISIYEGSRYMDCISKISPTLIIRVTLILKGLFSLYILFH